MIITYKAVADSEMEPGRAGLDWPINVLDDGDKLTEIHPPKPEENLAISRVGDNSVVEVTVKGEGYRTMSVVIAYINDLRVPLWLEFHGSTRKNELFFINPNGQLRYHHDEIYTCIRTSTDQIQHWGQKKGASLRFDVEILNT